MIVDLWSRGCERLAAELPEQQFNTWIRPLPTPLVARGVQPVGRLDEDTTGLPLLSDDGVISGLF